METCNRCWLFWIHSQGELQLQWTADRQGSDSQLDTLLLSILSREYKKAEKVPEGFLFFTCGLEFTKAYYNITSS